MVILKLLVQVNAELHYLQSSWAVLPLTTGVNLGKLPNASEFQFPRPQSGANDIYIARAAGKMKMRYSVREHVSSIFHGPGSI